MDWHGMQGSCREGEKSFREIKLWNGSLVFTSQIETLSSPQHAKLPTVSRSLQEIKTKPRKSVGIALSSQERTQLTLYPDMSGYGLRVQIQIVSKYLTPKIVTKISWRFHSRFRTKSREGHLSNTLVKTSGRQGVAKQWASAVVLEIIWWQS